VRRQHSVVVSAATFALIPGMWVSRITEHCSVKDYGRRNEILYHGVSHESAGTMDLSKLSILYIDHARDGKPSYGRYLYVVPYVPTRMYDRNNDSVKESTTKHYFMARNTPGLNLPSTLLLITIRQIQNSIESM
jgi:hypothetical protein